MNDNGNKTDNRPDPNPRKNAQLWQAYLWWDELIQMRKRHNNRILAIEAGKSNLDAGFERTMLAKLGQKELADAEIDGGRTVLDVLTTPRNKAERGFSVEIIMIEEGEKLGAVWDWAVSIKGIAGRSLAPVLAQIDDIGKFDTVSRLWRFSGYAVIDGKAERGAIGEKRHYNAKLKSYVWNIVQNFIKQQTPVYSEIYYEYKARKRREHPIPTCRECGDDAEPKQKGKHQVWRCPNNAKHVVNHTDMHLHKMAERKVAKIWLQHLWVVWRESEGLPVSEPYVQAIMGHTHIVEVVNSLTYNSDVV